MSSARILVRAAIYDDFSAQFLAHIREAVTVGDPRGRHTVIGPVISADALEKTRARIGRAVAAGGRTPHRDTPSRNERKLTSDGPRETRGPAGGTPALPDASLFKYFLATADDNYAKQLAALSVARGEAVKFSTGQKEIMVMRELSEPKKAHILFRGEYNQ